MDADSSSKDIPLYPLIPSDGGRGDTFTSGAAVMPAKAQQEATAYPALNHVPLGLDCLIDVDHILINQHAETLEFLVGSSAANKYSITHPSGKKLLYAAEYSSVFARQLVGGSRAFEMKIFNADNNREVLNAKRRWKCGLFGCCSARCVEDMQVTSPQQDPIGSVLQVYQSCKMYFAIKDEHGDTQFQVRPPQKMIFFSDWEFGVFDVAGNNIGEIRKKWAGLGQEMFTQADNFGIKFPASLDLKYKALLINACILLDYIYFEKN